MCIIGILEANRSGFKINPAELPEFKRAKPDEIELCLLLNY